MELFIIRDRLLVRFQPLAESGEFAIEYADYGSDANFQIPLSALGHLVERERWRKFGAPCRTRSVYQIIWHLRRGVARLLLPATIFTGLCFILS
jgi:hypothetical protein